MKISPVVSQDMLHTNLVAKGLLFWAPGANVLHTSQSSSNEVKIMLVTSVETFYQIEGDFNFLFNFALLGFKIIAPGGHDLHKPKITLDIPLNYVSW